MRSSGDYTLNLVWSFVSLSSFVSSNDIVGFEEWKGAVVNVDVNVNYNIKLQFYTYVIIL